MANNDGCFVWGDSAMSRGFSVMQIKNEILKVIDSVLDTPLMRPLTSYLLSSWASSVLQRRVRVFYDSVWLRSDGEITIALGPRLRPRRSQILSWKPNAAELTDLAASWWYLFYKPKTGDVIVDIGAGM